MQFPHWASKRKKRVHLDYASTTPVKGEVFDAMKPYFCDMWANPSSIYKEGVAMRNVIEEQRTKLAEILRVRPNDVTFTSGGTESNNLALIGVIEAKRKEGVSYEEMEIISTKIEHPSILETLSYLEGRGVCIVYAPVDTDGLVDTKSLEALLSQKTILITIAYVNSEIGVVQDIKKITRIVRKWNDSNKTNVRVHTDASQAPLWLSCALDTLGVDMMTLDAGKCYGPKGVGVLIHRHWVELTAVTFGGGQEGGLRSGTENTPLIVGCVHALTIAQEEYLLRSEKITKLRDTSFALLESNIKGVVVNGSKEMRVSNNINISIPGVDTEYATIVLDAKGIAVATRSACGALGNSGSHVVREMTHDEGRAISTIRFTLGEDTSKNDIAYATKILAEHIERMKTSVVAEIHTKI